ncbi:MAG: hypothetical protein DMG21_00130 [Acidobacteria bacterium]|nr:MAG: hypothetical protein DMG21_00130 [Acidobacteriota bacterium]
MACPICQKRKPKRYCPAKSASICSVCCGTEREVTLDCPPDCPYLVESRRHEAERREPDWSKVPFAETRIPASFVESHEQLILALSYAASVFARDNRPLVDTDTLAAFQQLAEAYRTLASGLYYEQPPAGPLAHGLYVALKAGIEDFKKTAAREAKALALRDSEIRDALILLTQVGSTRANGRPKGRAYLDFLRSQFRPEQFARPESNIIVVP